MKLVLTLILFQLSYQNIFEIDYFNNLTTKGQGLYKAGWQSLIEELKLEMK